MILCHAKARIDAPDALRHIIVRGIERRKIFYDNGDRDHFLGRLGVVLAETSTPCFAWTLIPNHVLCKALHKVSVPIYQELLDGYLQWLRHYRHADDETLQVRAHSIRRFLQ